MKEIKDWSVIIHYTSWIFYWNRWIFYSKWWFYTNKLMESYFVAVDLRCLFQHHTGARLILRKKTMIWTLEMMISAFQNDGFAFKMMISAWKNAHLAILLVHWVLRALALRDLRQNRPNSVQSRSKMTDFMPKMVGVILTWPRRIV